MRCHPPYRLVTLQDLEYNGNVAFGSWKIAVNILGMVEHMVVGLHCCLYILGSGVYTDHC